MGITVSSDFADLDRLVSALDNPGAIMDDIGASLAEETIALVREGFAKSADPYGAAWAPRKTSQNAGSRLLVKTAAMRNSFNTTHGNRNGFGVRAGVGYATFHQRGTSAMVARKTLPDPGDIPALWRVRFDDVAQEVIEMHVGRR